ncbi:MAG: hypothetical protein OXC10_12215 [Rhodospirillaceae bacterium]|nr:hypothetical protein [Rhodospirillaceae bacterium]
MPVEKTISVSRLFLNQENPRHQREESEEGAILQLCENEAVSRLARDIAQHGLSPLEKLAVFPDGEDAYVVAEGNRRLCAIKLLNDPQLAPSKLQQNFEKLAENWSAISEVPCVVFDEPEDAALRLWMERRHSGEQGGIGLKNWNAEQKQRFSGGKKNRIALAILDHAEEEGLISADQRKGKLTTVQRYLANPVFRNTLGIDDSNASEVCRNRPAKDFGFLLKKFIGDLISGSVNSRTKAAEHVAYAQSLESLEELSKDRIEPESLQSTSSSEQGSSQSGPRKRRKIPLDNDIRNALESLNNYKLQRLYHSVCTVSLEAHTPLVAVGLWAFFETLTAAAGRRDQTNFTGFLSASRLSKYGLDDKSSRKVAQEALKRIADFGNTTKHHSTSAAFSGEQLANDMETLKPVILECAQEARGST